MSMTVWPVTFSLHLRCPDADFDFGLSRIITSQRTGISKQIVLRMGQILFS